MAQSTDSGTAVPFGNKYAKKEAVYDLMRGGPGTPWENRGEFGPVGGFVRAAMRSLLKPTLLFDHIRGTTVTSDARSFLWICAGCWGASAAVHAAILYFRYSSSESPRYNIAIDQFLIVTVIAIAAAVGWAFFMFRFITGFYHKLVITEIKQPIPVTLTTNVVAYAMGPSLLAPIPFVGPVLAFVGAFLSLCAAGRKRLYVSWRGAIIDALLPFVVAFVLSLVAFFVGQLILGNVFSAVEEALPYGLPDAGSIPAAP